MTGMSFAACTMAHAIRWVKESFLPAPLSCLRRPSSESTSMVRKLVAVGIERLSFMKRTSVAAGPAARLGARGGRCSRGGGAVALDGGFHVVLGDTAPRTRALQAGHVDAIGGCHARGDRRGV